MGSCGFLRNGCRLVGSPPEHLLEQVRADAQSFGIGELVSALDEKINQAQAPHAGLGRTQLGL